MEEELYDKNIIYGGNIIEKLYKINQVEEKHEGDQF